MTRGETEQRIERISITFRFLTFVLIGVVGWFIVHYLGNIDTKFEKVDNKLDMFVKTYHTVDKRLDRLEVRNFGEPYYQKQEDSR
jgi:hypothetical protein